MTSIKMLQKRSLFLSVLSLPFIWGILQGYHLFVKFLAQWILAAFPQGFVPYQPETLFIIAFVNLGVWGTAALIWPAFGFGQAWTPHRTQGIVVLVLMSVCLISAPLVHYVFQWETPFKNMGWVVWTITPVSEEIFFRGFLYVLGLRLFQQSPTSSFKEVLPALILGAAWFSLWHLSPPAIIKYGWQIVGIQVVGTFFAGLVFNSLRHWTGSIWLVIPVHAAGNFMMSAI